MRKCIALSFLAVLAFLAFPAQAAEIGQYSLEFDIQPSGEVREELHAVFSQEVGEASFTYMFAGDISGLRITDGRTELQHSVEKSGAQNTVSILVPAGTKEIYIDFSTRDLVFWNGNIMHFFTNFRPPTGLGRADITVILPLGFSLYRDMCSPPNPVRSTDGSRISLAWVIESPEEIPISVKAHNPYQSADFLLLPAVAAIFAIGFAGLFFWSRKRSHYAFLKGFSEDERKTIEILRQRKSVYQNRLEKELGFSKARMTRLAQRLEKKGLIEREKAGRTRRIDWKG